MLPDLEKRYDTEPVISELWDQFGEAVSRARRILIVGHSLHDRALLQLLRERVDSHSRIGATVLPEGGDADEVTGRLREHLPQATAIPLSFGTSQDPNPGIETWMAMTDALTT